METAELEGVTFRCLEGCGFCCTFQPEVSTLELARLRRRFAPRPIPVAVGEEGRTYLQLQNKCGGCTLLERRGCTAYDLRPAHCRYFPFHVHFGDRTEAYVNYTCRGVERAPGADVRAAFQANVASVARDEEWREHERLAREAYATFQRRARKAGAWGDVEAALAEALAMGPTLFTRAGLEEACRRGGEPVPADEAAADALAPFEREDVAARPFHLTPDLRWVTFSRPDAHADALQAWEMDETGQLAPLARLDGVAGWRDPAPDLAAALHAILRRLASRRLFAGSVYALVDDSEYETSVEQAAWLRVAEVAADLALRARVLAAMGVAPEALADETARFYDSAFLDSPTIGGWL